MGLWVFLFFSVHGGVMRPCRFYLDRVFSPGVSSTALAGGFFFMTHTLPFLPVTLFSFFSSTSGAD
jgi:hypothetical protein